MDDVIATGDTSMPPTPESFGGFVILTSGTTGLPKGAQRSKVSPFTSALLLDRVPLPQRGSVNLTTTTRYGKDDSATEVVQKSTSKSTWS